MTTDHADKAMTAFGHSYRYSNNTIAMIIIKSRVRRCWALLFRRTGMRAHCCKFSRGKNEPFPEDYREN